jgi:DNA-binding NtrC family response regulator
MARICVVDDKELIRDSLTETLTRDDHQVTAFGDSVEALGAIRQGGFDLLLSDLKMPRLDGIALMRELRAAGCETPVIVMTAFGTVATAVEAMWPTRTRLCVPRLMTCATCARPWAAAGS